MEYREDVTEPEVRVKRECSVSELFLCGLLAFGLGMGICYPLANRNAKAELETRFRLIPVEYNGEVKVIYPDAVGFGQEPARIEVSRKVPPPPGPVPPPPGPSNVPPGPRGDPPQQNPPAPLPPQNPPAPQKIQDQIKLPR